MWHIKGFIPGFGCVTSEYSFWKKDDAQHTAEEMEKKGTLSRWELVYKSTRFPLLVE